MPQDIAPKVELNEDYLDLRSRSNKTNSVSDRKSIQTRQVHFPPNVVIGYMYSIVDREVLAVGYCRIPNLVKES